MWNARVNDAIDILEERGSKLCADSFVVEEGGNAKTSWKYFTTIEGVHVAAIHTIFYSIFHFNVFRLIATTFKSDFDRLKYSMRNWNVFADWFIIKDHVFHSFNSAVLRLTFGWTNFLLLFQRYLFDQSPESIVFSCRFLVIGKVHMISSWKF